MHDPELLVLDEPTSGLDPLVQAELLKDVEWLLGLSPYHWAYRNSPVSGAADWSAAGWLWGISAVLVLLGAVALDRRDVGS